MKTSEGVKKNTIKALIKKEDEAAFKILPREALRSRLEARLKGEAEKKQPLISRFLKPVLISLLAALMICVVTIRFLMRTSNPEHIEVVNTIKILLQNGPGFNSMVTIDKINSQNIGREESDDISKNTYLKQFLISLLKKKEFHGERDLILKTAELDSQLAVRDFMMILVKDQTVFRFLSRYMKHFKEVTIARKVSILIFIILFFWCIVLAEIVSPFGVKN